MPSFLCLRSRFHASSPVAALILVFLALFAQANAASAASTSRTNGGPTLEQCSWDRPGHDPYRGDTAAALDRYSDIDPATRARLKARIARRDYDDMVTIRRDSITGKGRYGRTISDMYFGQSTVCKNVSRAAWTEAMQERGLVYCDGRDCILVPTVCRNVSRISRAGVSPETAAGDVEPVALVAAAPAKTQAVEADAPRPDASTTFAEVAAPPGTPPLGWPGADTPEGPGQGVPGVPGGPIVVGGGGGGAGGGSGGGGLPPVAPIPEPGTWALMLTGLVALVVVAKRRRREHLPVPI